MLRAFAVVYAVGLSLIAACVWRGDFTSSLYDVVNRIAAPDVWAGLFAVGAVGFAVEAIWVAAVAGWRVWLFRVGMFAAIFTLLVRGIGLLLSPVLGNGVLVAATPAAIAWLMIAALIVIHMWSREGVR